MATSLRTLFGGPALLCPWQGIGRLVGRKKPPLTLAKGRLQGAESSLGWVGLGCAKVQLLTTIPEHVCRG
jgi:hypothetical protein